MISSLARVAAAAFRAAADELDPKPVRGQKRDLAGTTGGSFQVHAGMTGPRRGYRQGRSPRPIGFTLPGDV